MKRWILALSCVKKCFDFCLKSRGCKIAFSSNSGLESIVSGCSFLGSFGRQLLGDMCQNIVIYNVFDVIDTGFVQKPWFLLHSVGVALCSPRGPEANFDECFGKSKETDAQPIAPETHSRARIRLRATKKQPPSKRQATAKQPPSNRRLTAEQRCCEPLPLPRDSSKEESKKNNREDRTEKTEARRQNTREAESQYDCMTVMTEGCNDCMLVMTVRL